MHADCTSHNNLESEGPTSFVQLTMPDIERPLEKFGYEPIS